MNKDFNGIWGTFEYLDDMCNAIKEVRSAGYQKLTTHSPCPRHEIDHALGDPQSRIPFFTLAGSLLGGTLAVTIMILMTLDLILPVSGKPVVSIPIMGPVFFELSVLISVWTTVAFLFVLIIRDQMRHDTPQSKRYKDYDRFLRDRFGVVVPCNEHDYEKVEAIFNKYQAEEVHREA